ncbi:MAG TPA: GNAT family protein [Fluviicola sp.]|nr:GNAT family protein [Fluviicola sp.]
MPDNSIQLSTERFLVRSLTANDVPELLSFIDLEPELWKYALVPCNDRPSMQQYLDEAFADYEKGTALPFVVIDRSSGKIVGSTRFYDFQPHNGSTLLGYTWYSKHQQGNGINTDCKYLMLEYAFETLNLERVELRADLRNKRSIAAMLKIGFTQEGILRNHLPVADGTRRDSIIFSALKDEWFGGIKANLERQISR